MTRIVMRLLCSVWVVLLCQALQAGVLTLEDGMLAGKLPLTPYIAQYGGHSPPNDIRAAAELSDAGFAPVGTASPVQIGHTGWFRFAIHNPSTRARQLIVDFDQSMYTRVEWHAASPSATKYVLTGQDYAFNSRDVDYDFFAFRLDVPAGETLVVNFSLFSRYPTLFVPTLSDSDTFTANVAFYNRVLGGIMGMLYSVALFMLFYLFHERRSYLAQALCVLSLASMFSVLFVSGAIQRWLPDASDFHWPDVMYLVIHGLQGSSFVVALQLFYLSNGSLAWLRKPLWAVALAQSASVLLVPFVSVEPLLMLLLAANGLAMLVSVGLAVWSVLSRREGTYLFSTGLLLSMGLTIISVLSSQGWLPSTWLSRYGYELGLTIQVDFIFIAAVSTMANSLLQKQKTDAALLQLNAEAAAREKFVSQVTHDIKSPLSAVVGAEELLRDETDSEKRQQFLGIVRDSSQLVLRMVDDMLGHSALQRGSLQLQPQHVELPTLLAQWESMFCAIPRSENVQFDCVWGEDLPRFVLADPLRLTQLISNLVTNAFKFTERGTVRLQVESLSREAGKTVLQFTVRDTGIGMSESFQAKAFMPYAREESRIAGRRGFGLGLSICQQLAELMQGSIRVESQPGEGSCFTVELPFLLVN